MGFAAQALLLPVEDGVHGRGGEVVLHRPLPGRQPLARQMLARFLARLLGGVGVVHSLVSCDFV